MLTEYAHTRLRSAIILLCIAISGCSSGATVRDESDSIAIIKPLTTSANQFLEASLDWVIIRGGPGSWADNVDWDEYLLHVTNISESSIRITSVYVYDSLNTALETNGQRPELVEQTKQSKKRYNGQGFTVRAGMGGDAMMAAGGAVYVAATAAGWAVLAGSVAATSAVVTGVVVGAVIVAPVLIISGAVRGRNNAQLDSMIIERQTKLPLVLVPRETRKMHFFFPLAPSPQRVEIKYRNDAGEHILLIDTRDILSGLHFDPSQEPSE